MANNKITYAIAGVAVLVLVAAIAMNVSVTGKAYGDEYVCTGSYPQYIVQADRTHFANCPGTHPYCNSISAAAGNPECCRVKLANGYDDCITMSKDIQPHQ